jgi:hypothetical protein
METSVPVLELLLQLLPTRYGAYLTPEQLATVRQGLERAEQLTHTLRAYPLVNADAPVLVLHPYRAERD